MSKRVSSPVIVALDFDNKASLLQLVDQLDPSLCRLKVGKEVFTRFGPELLTVLVERDFDVFLDLKFHDIPTTVAKALTAAADLGVWMVNVHALGGLAMMQAAKKALAPFDGQTKLIAVTVLTSLSDAELAVFGLPSCDRLALQLAQLAKQASLDGVVCSALEASAIKAHCGENFITVTPGIRPVTANQDDQNRTMTPAAAIASGADYLVIGRPITQHKKPLQSLHAILDSLDAGSV